jgi:cell division transport system permease protein
MVLSFQLGFFMLLVANINHMAAAAMGKLQLTAVLSAQAGPDKAGVLKQRLLKDPRVERVQYVPKDLAFQRLKVRLGGRVDLNNLTRNPLPDTLIIDLKDPKKIREAAEDFKKYPGIETFRYGDDKLIDRLLKLSQRIYTTGIVVIAMLLISAVILIANTIRLTVFSRRKEIEIMELVGAARWFIRGPFITEGVIHGLVGSGLAIILLNYLYSAGAGWIIQDMPFIPVMPPGLILPDASLSILAVGIIVGGSASFFSVNKYLKK